VAKIWQRINKRALRSFPQSLDITGADDGIRTRNLLIKIQLKPILHMIRYHNIFVNQWFEHFN